nr:transmembrane protein 25 isoform X4 [Zootoca vivipara]
MAPSSPLSALLLLLLPPPGLAEPETTIDGRALSFSNLQEAESRAFTCLSAAPSLAWYLNGERQESSGSGRFLATGDGGSGSGNGVAFEESSSSTFVVTARRLDRQLNCSATDPATGHVSNASVLLNVQCFLDTRIELSLLVLVVGCVAALATVLGLGGLISCAIYRQGKKAAGRCRGSPAGFCPSLPGLALPNSLSSLCRTCPTSAAASEVTFPATGSSSSGIEFGVKTLCLLPAFPCRRCLHGHHTGTLAVRERPSFLGTSQFSPGSKGTGLEGCQPAFTGTAQRTRSRAENLKECGLRSALS